MTSKPPVQPRLALVVPTTDVAADTVDTITASLLRLTTGPERPSRATDAAGLRLVDSAVQELVIPRPEQRVNHDPEAGPPDRMVVRDHLGHVSAPGEWSGVRTGVLHVHVDGFTQIKDTLGHTAGDIVLTEVARRLHGAARCGETVARVSGDEFVVVCEGLIGSRAQVASRLEALVDRFATALSEPATGGRLEVVVTATIGAAVAPAPRLRDAENLLRAADAAVHEAKRAGAGHLAIDRSKGRTRTQAVAAGDSPRASPAVSDVSTHGPRRSDRRTRPWRGFVGVRLVDQTTSPTAPSAG